MRLLEIDRVTAEEVEGGPLTEHALACYRFDVTQAAAILERKLREGIPSAPVVVRGRPLVDWLLLDDVLLLVAIAVPKP